MKLSWQIIRLPLLDPWKIATQKHDNARTEAQNIIVKIVNCDGIVGWGEASPPVRFKESIETTIDFLKRVDPSQLKETDLSSSIEYLETLSKGHYAAKSAIDIALWDIKGKISSKPVWMLLDLPAPSTAPPTSMSIGISPPDIIRDKVLKYAAFQTLKIKMGGTHDHETLSAIREVAPDKLLRIDANEGWKTPDEALRQIEWLAQDGRVELIEQPMPASNPESDWKWLKQRSPLPLWADESHHGPNEIRSILSNFDGINVKLAKCGGISAAKQCLQTIHMAGLQTMLGCFIESCLGIGAAYHLAGLAQRLDLDGHLLVATDPFQGIKHDGAGNIVFNNPDSIIGTGITPRENSTLL